MKVKEESEKAVLKLNIEKMKNMASGPIISWQIDREIMETVTDFYFLGLQNHCGRSLRPWNYKHSLLGRKAMTDLDSILKSRDITLLTMVCIVKAMVFPVVLYRCDSWTIKMAEHQRTDAFELWMLEKFLRVPWTARRSSLSVLKEINPENLLEGLMLNLKRQSFGHEMWRTNSSEKTQCWERLRAGREGGNRGWDGRMSSLTQWTWVLANSGP